MLYHGSMQDTAYNRLPRDVSCESEVSHQASQCAMLASDSGTGHTNFCTSRQCRCPLAASGVRHLQLQSSSMRDHGGEGVQGLVALRPCTTHLLHTLPLRRCHQRSGGACLLRLSARAPAESP